MSTLYVVATPVGNLEDITLRALRVLKEVDVILCEDTRVTKKLLERYSIHKPTASYHQHSKLHKTEQIIEWLREGKNIALVSDAGTPGVSDPGNQLVKEVAEQLPEIAIVPIPGVSALTALASVAGFPMDKFVFLGFPPLKKGRKTFFEQVARLEYPVILYESPHRILKTLREIAEPISNQQSTIQVAVGRELTKKFETIYRGSPAEVAEQIGTGQQKGEFVLAVNLGKTRT